MGTTRRASWRVALALPSCAALVACASHPASSSPSPARASTPRADGGEATPVATPSPPRPREEPTIVDLWRDETPGPLSTLVYVTEQVGRDGKVGPAALVFSSDPANAHFKRGSTQRVTVQRLPRADMGALLADLDGAGLRRLPWSAEPVDAQIGPARALYAYEGGQRGRVEKAAIDDEGRRAFTAIERRLIQESARDHEGPVRGAAETGGSSLPAPAR